MKTISLKCNKCGKRFDRKIHEHKNNISRGRTNTFCSRSCSSAFGNSNRPPDFYKSCNYYDISKHAGNRLNELSPFQSFLGKGRASIKEHKVEIDAPYLKKLWESQNGVCPYTGIKMILPKSSSSNHRIKSLKTASLDRIDSSKEYIEGNVEFVCQAINLAKNKHSKEEMIEFIRSIKSNKGGGGERS